MNRIYIANLGKYNEGCLVGGWLPLPFTEEEQQELFLKIKLAHLDEEGEYTEGFEENGVIYEEWAIHDYETDFDMTISEYTDIWELSEQFEEFENLDSYDIKKIEAYMEAYGGDFQDAIDKVNDIEFYEDFTLIDLAEHLLENCCFGENLMKVWDENPSYIDIEYIARELRYDYTEVSNGVIRCD